MGLGQIPLIAWFLHDEIALQLGVDIVNTAHNNQQKQLSIQQKELLKCCQSNMMQSASLVKSALKILHCIKQQ